MSEQRFKVGDIVRLLSGGPRMAVLGVNEDEIECLWFTREGSDGNERWAGPFRERFRDPLLVQVIL